MSAGWFSVIRDSGWRELLLLGLAMGAATATMVLFLAVAYGTRQVIGIPPNASLLTALWITSGLLAAHATAGAITGRMAAHSPRQSVIWGTVAGLYGVLLVTLGMVLLFELWLDPVADFRSLMVALGINEVPGTLGGDVYGDPTINPPPNAYEKLMASAAYICLLMVMLVSAAALGGLAGYHDDGEE